MGPSPLKAHRDITAAEGDGHGGTGLGGTKGEVIPLRKERLAVGRRQVETGRMRIATEAEEILVREALRAERVPPTASGTRRSNRREVDQP